MLADPLLRYLFGKSILILGFGREGRSSLRFLARHWEELAIPRLGIADAGGIDLGIADDGNIELQALEPELFAGAAYLDRVGEFDVVLKSPGISLKPWTADLIRPGVLGRWPRTEVTGQIDLFLRFCDVEATVGITGTKGKSTTATLIAQILERTGRNTYLVGNIGIPVLDYWEQYSPDDAVVLELSSHQLQFAQASPHYSVITNLYPEHLDHYISYDEYVESKLNILRYQNADGYFVLNKDDEDLARRAEPLIRGDREEVGLADGMKWHDLNRHLQGRHHAYDMAFAAAVCTKLGLTEAEIREGISHFSGIPHRCEYIGTFKDVEFYNDSISTIPQSTMFAVETLGNVSTLIVGGMDRGVDYAEFLEYLKETSIRNIICLPDTGRAVLNYFDSVELGRAVFAQTMEDAVNLAFERTEPGHSCLLSPAASSYHHWKNFEERGNEFRRLVQNHD